jgi:SAM-dependent methyltransferase
MPDDMQALAELKRVLKPDGWGVLMAPINLALVKIDEDPTIISEDERWRRFGQFDHVRIYSKKGFSQRVQKSGFHMIELGIFLVKRHSGAQVFQKRAFYMW